MKAIVHRDFGPPDVLRCEEVDQPAPADHEVLLRIHAAAVNPLDWRMMRGEPSIFRLLLGSKEKRIGRDAAGVIEAVGKNVTRFKPGDEVFGSCQGAFAEYASARESRLALKPEKVTFEQAASLPIAGLTALQGLRDSGRMRSGQKLLINGAAGGVGTFAVQIAKTLGAHVTGVCSSKNVDLVRSLGADRVLDYTREDFTAGEDRYDVILDCVGNRSLTACKRVLSHQGICVIVGAPKAFGKILATGTQSFLLSLFTRQKFAMFIAKTTPVDLATLARLVETGQLTPIIDQRYPLSEAAAAVRYLEAGHARGKVMIMVE